MRIKNLLPLLLLISVLSVPVYADGIISDPPVAPPTLDGVISDPPVSAQGSDLLAAILAAISAVLP